MNYDKNNTNLPRPPGQMARAMFAFLGGGGANIEGAILARGPATRGAGVVGIQFFCEEIPE